MHVMYVAPRFHTNQVDLVKGWIDRGNEVTFVSYYKVLIEDYKHLEPVVLGYSPIFYLLDWIYVNIIKRGDIESAVFRINYGIPPIIKLFFLLKRKRPDLIIIRDRTLYSIVTNIICKLFRYETILYNQSPLWDLPPKSDWLHRLVRLLTPKKRITPVMGFEEEGKMVSKDSYFVPFVQEPRVNPNDRQYVSGDRVSILSVGKFIPRKHHIMLLRIFNELKKSYPEMHLSLVGEATSKGECLHLQEVYDFINKNNLEEDVSVYTNLTREELGKKYVESDLFVIPSTREMASISQLEAMSYSLPVIISDKNGAVQYVEDGVNGYWFKDCDENSLREKIALFLEDKTQIEEMGKASYNILCEKYQFENYYSMLMKIYDN